MRLLSMFTFILSLAAGCKVEMVPIEYGADACHYCNMTIVDRQHAAEIVTDKGRAYKFDAIECMLNHIKTIDSTTIGLYLVADFNSPGELVNATTATFIISKEIASPMGAFLSASGNSDKMEELRAIHGGQLFGWKEIILHFRNTDGILDH